MSTEIENNLNSVLANSQHSLSNQNDIDEDEDVDVDVNQMSSDLICRIVDLHKLQEEEDALHTEYRKERLALEQKYNQLRAIKYKKRLDIVNANIMLSSRIDDDETETEVGTQSNAFNIDTKQESLLKVGVPGFWLQVLANHPVVGHYVEEGDVEALTSLEDIACEYNEEMSSFTIVFLFKKNMYFRNRCLRKCYTVIPDLLDDRSPALLSATCPDSIDWIDPQHVLIADCKPHPINGHLELYAKSSFFHFFDEPQPLTVLDLQANTEDSENLPVGVEIESGSDSIVLSSSNNMAGEEMPAISLSSLPEVSINMEALNATYNTIRSSVLSIGDELFRPSFGMFRFGSPRYESARATLVGLGEEDGQAIAVDAQTNVCNNFKSKEVEDVPQAQLVSPSAVAPSGMSISCVLPSYCPLNHPFNNIDMYRLSVKHDYEIAHIIRTVLIPNAVGWYTGELMEVEE